MFDRLKRFLRESGILKDGVTAGGQERGGDVHPAARVVSTALFVGYAPVAQGTFGSLWIPVVWHVLHPFVSLPRTHLVLAGLAVILYGIGVWAAGECERAWGHDPGRVVIDEVVGMLVAVLFIPLSMFTVWAGFILFRAFDVLKPPPVRSFEKARGGYGVMNDDVAAGILANICLRVILHVLA